MLLDTEALGTVDCPGCDGSAMMVRRSRVLDSLIFSKVFERFSSVGGGVTRPHTRQEKD